ncbi:M50 family metallopeptidase [Nesterenkonia lacusekhoensis]|uniref:Membrane-associated protease RseP (Regulator of RpoE activity) n=1 Tax=Nesterenkonia lacusekhoensis TaxID=150832 RepID=A0ABS4T3W0_9MICC|nr:site-2 protease family protein [Nesterenkonia lacusekhoensis]MBP2318563.1 membrane-associated protease RseP (regulator of RpoE activity) [Nesterenkonia lacusekhoensis]
MTALLMTVGILIVVIGIMLSIALHEVGHLLPAKLFKVRVTQYMVGFGSTIWSRRRGETEYGIKAIPLGGYVAMTGMYPPPDEDKNNPEIIEDDAGPEDAYLRELNSQYGEPPAAAAGSAGEDGAPRAGDESTDTTLVRSQATGLFQQMSAEAREVAAEELQPGDEDRMFYRLPIWKRIIIMLGGPLMNGLIALVITAGTISLHGTEEPTTQVNEVFECVVSAEDSDAGQDECTASDPAGPAYQAGLRPGDEIVAFGGQEVQEWEELTGLIQQSADQSTQLEYLRDGERHTTTLTPLLVDRPVTDGLGRAERDGDGNLITEPVGFIGMGAGSELQRQPVTEAGPIVWEQTKAVGEVVVQLPWRLYDVAESTFTSAERDPEGPMSVVGVGRMAGELSAQEQIPLESRFATLMSLVAGVNIALMVFNLIPLLPLDGGHVAGALYEGLRRRLAKLLGRPDPGPFDISKLLPLTYLVAVLLLGMGALLILADIINPIRLFE